EEGVNIWTWFASDASPYPNLAADIAFVTSGDCLTVIRASENDLAGSVEEIDEAAIAAWHAPRWLDFHSWPDDQITPFYATERWDQENTRLQLLAVQRWIWHRLDTIIETSRLEAIVRLEVIAEKVAAGAPRHHIDSDFKALSDDYRKISF